jgi:hypothetical protein
LKEWHHLVAVIDQSRGRAYLAVDGKISAGSGFTGLLATKNETRFVIGGGEAGKAFLFGMADEVRVTQDIRYPEADFTPPTGSLTQDNPFVDGFQNTVHGLWRFDERAGSTLFLDVSLRTNDLFLVTEKGFRPFGRMAHARVFHTALTLKNDHNNNNNIWIAGGIDDGGNSAPESEVIDFATNQILPGATVNMETDENISVTDNQIGVGDGSRGVFSTTLPFSPLGLSMTIKTDAFRATDNSQGRLISNTFLLDEPNNNVNYSAGVITVKLPSPPAASGDVKIVATLIDPTRPPAVVTAENSGNTLLVKGVPKGSIDQSGIARVTFPLPVSEGSVVVTANPARITGRIATGNANGILTGGGIFGRVVYGTGNITAFFTGPPIRNSVFVTIGTPLVTVQDTPDPDIPPVPPATTPTPSPRGKFFIGSGGTPFGDIDYQTGVMTLDFNNSIDQGTVKIEANSASIDVTDRQIGNTSTGSFSGDGISSGTVDYNSRTVAVNFSSRIQKQTAVVTVKNQADVPIATASSDADGKFKVGSSPVDGSIDYETGVMSVTFPATVSMIPTKVSVHAFSLPIQVTDVSNGNQVILSGPGIFLGTANGETNEVAFNFASPPANLSPILLGYTYKRKSGISDHTATLLDDGKVLVAGGQDAGPIIGTPQKGALLFNPADDSVVKTGSLLEARRFHTAGLLANNTVLVVGGEGASNQALQSTERFDPLSGQFSAGPNLKQARKLHKMINLKECSTIPVADRILVVGGEDGNHRPLTTAEIYDPADQTKTDFTLTGSMVTPRTMHTLTCLPDGKVLVAGGVDQGGAVTFTAEIFDPSTGRFGPVESGGMIFSRAGHTATLLSDGKILIAGGLNQFQLPLSSAEIYDPVQRTFALLPTALGFARFGHIALPWKGSILFIGGAGATGRAFSLVESYVP